MPIDKNRLRTELISSPQRHGRVDAELACRIRRRRHYAALVRLAADNHRLAFERWIVQLFHGDEERVHVDVEVGSHLRTHPAAVKVSRAFARMESLSASD